jgi:polysaccharide biosynthesis transport protein
MNYQRGSPAEDSSASAGGLVPVGQQFPIQRDPYSVPVPYGEANDSPQVFGLTIHDYLRILLKRKWLILSIVGASVVIGAVATLMKTPLYTSTARVQIDPVSLAAKVTDPNATAVEDPDANFMRTQYELLRGRTMAERVAEQQEG